MPRPPFSDEMRSLPRTAEWHDTLSVVFPALLWSLDDERLARPSSFRVGATRDDISIIVPQHSTASLRHSILSTHLSASSVVLSQTPTHAPVPTVSATNITLTASTPVFFLLAALARVRAPVRWCHSTGASATNLVRARKRTRRRRSWQPVVAPPFARHTARTLAKTEPSLLPSHCTVAAVPLPDAWTRHPRSPAGTASPWT